MPTLTLEIALALSIIGSLTAAFVAVWPGRQARRLSSWLLLIGALAGVLVGVSMATGQLRDVLTITLPNPLQLFYGMIFSLDRFAAIFYTSISLVAALVAMFSIPFFERYPPLAGARNVSALMACLMLGMQGVVLSTNIVGFMTFWELMSLCSFLVVIADGTWVTRKVGFVYLTLTHIFSGAILAGLFLLSGGALLSDFSVLATFTSQVSQLSAYTALALLLFGFAGQVGLVPFHIWIGEALASTKAPASALLSGGLLNVAVYGFLRILITMLPGVPLWFVLTIIGLGLASAVIGVLQAAVSRDTNRILAHNNSEYLGIIFTMIGVGLLAGQTGHLELTRAALYAALFMTVAHAIFKTGLLLAAGLVTASTGSRRLEAMGGLAKRMPRMSVAVFVLSLSAAALPPFGPFVAEWLLLQAMIGTILTASPALQVALVIIISLLCLAMGQAVFSMIKYFSIVYLGQPRSAEATLATEPDRQLFLPIGIAAGLSLWLGVFAPLVFDQFGASDFVTMTREPRLLIVSQTSLAPLSLGLVLAGLAIGLFGLRRVFGGVQPERELVTWNGGQALTSRMEYTATGLSAPIRFFFRFFLHTQKAIISTPQLPGNPWLTTRSMSLLVDQIWYDRLYIPTGKALLKLANWVSKLQNGSLQFYLGLTLLTLLVTMLVAL